MEFADTKVSVPSDVLISELEDESVILNLESGVYFGLDDVGTRMWKVLSESETVQGAYEKLLGEYDVVPETLERDLRDFIDKLSAQGLIEVGIDKAA